MGFVGAIYRDLPQGARAEDFNYLLEIVHCTENGEQQNTPIYPLNYLSEMGSLL